MSTNQSIEIIQFPCLNDNYAFLIHDPISLQTAVVDTPDADEIIRQLELRGWQLSHILTTHHHWDHIDGHEALKQRYNSQVVTPEVNKAQVPQPDICVSEGSLIQFGHYKIQVIETPGHTLGHVSYWLPEANAVFVGDTLFSLGCGRLFEGTAQQMWQSILKIRALPDNTMIYCAHEYTAANARFAQLYDPDNEALQKRAEEIYKLRADNLATIPTTVKQERLTNPFMRADQIELQRALDAYGKPAEDVFAELRKRKDNA